MPEALAVIGESIVADLPSIIISPVKEE